MPRFDERLDEKLRDYVAQNRGATAAFDFDNTLVRGDLGETLLYHLAHHRLFQYNHEFVKAFQSDRDEAKLLQADRNEIDEGHAFTAIWRQLGSPLTPPGQALDSLDEQAARQLVGAAFNEYMQIYELYGGRVAYPWSAVLFSGFTPGEFSQICRDVLHIKDYRTIGTRKAGGIDFLCGFEPLEPMFGLIKLMLEFDWQVKVVTASPVELIRQWFIEYPEYNLEAGHVIGMNRPLEQDGRYGVVTTPPMTWGPGKVEALQAAGVNELAFAAGDTWTDLDMLQFAGQALLIDRGDRVLSDQAAQEGWWSVKQDDI